MARVTDPSGWSRSLEHAEIMSALPIPASKAMFKKRGSNWDGTLGNDHATDRTTTVEDIIWTRGTNWDNAPTDDSGYGSAGSRKRGTAWDNANNEDKRDALGPKVGTGGKAQPLYGNGWEQGRSTKESISATLASRADRPTIVDGGTPMPAQQSSCVSCMVKRLIRRFYPSGSWVAPGSQDLSDTPGHVKRAADQEAHDVIDGGKPTPLGANFRPAGGCINCLVKKWVSAPYVSSHSWFVPMVKAPTSGVDKQRVSRSEALRRSPRPDDQEMGADGGVPMPLCGICWDRTVKVAITAKESGWNE
ncbi:MAG: hypothetical protein Q9169_004453 [Polycauliona sp. 2 TL-2023]